MNNDVCFIIDNNELYFEKCLVDYDIPIFYVCKDSKGNRYIVLCYDTDEMSYLVAKSNNSEIVQMLEKKITMKQIFEKSKNIWKIYTEDDLESDKVEGVEFESINSEDLPVEKSFFEIASKDLKEYYDFIKCESEGYKLKKFIKAQPQIIWYMKNIQEYNIVTDSLIYNYSVKKKTEKNRTLFWSELSYKQVQKLSLEWENDCCGSELSVTRPKVTHREVLCCE